MWCPGPLTTLVDFTALFSSPTISWTGGRGCKTGQSRCGFTSAETKEFITSLSLLVTPQLTQPSTLLAFKHKSTHRLMFKVLLPRNPGSCSAVLPPTQPAPMQQVAPSQRQDFTSVLLENSFKLQVLSPTLQQHSLSTGVLLIPFNWNFFFDLKGIPHLSIQMTRYHKNASLPTNCHLLASVSWKIPSLVLWDKATACIQDLSCLNWLLFTLHCLLPRTYW